MSHVNVLVCKQVPGAVIHPQTKHFNRNQTPTHANQLQQVNTNDQQWDLSVLDPLLNRIKIFCLKK